MEKRVDEQAKKWGKLFARCWADEAFKQRFISDPVAVYRKLDCKCPSEWS